MLLHVTSDLHDDVRGNAIKGTLPIPEGVDAVVNAGDLQAPGHIAIRRLRELHGSTSIPLIYVPGNHDSYSFFDRKRPELRTTIERQRQELMPRAAEEFGVHLLDDAAKVIPGLDDILFIGATGWTDFEARPEWMSLETAERLAEKHMNDYRAIKVGEGRSKDVLRARDTIAMHMTSRMFIANELANKGDRDAVVITHHAPSFRSLRGYDPEAPGDFGDLDWCYASDLEYLMQSEHAPLLWIHGHLHDCHDYVVGGTRVICNARGYPDLGRRENPRFDPNLIIEIEPRPIMTLGMR